jgi:2-keto-4-pentenoate hydratase/2-oxohepta-3-ene-1,7-dioic acid hydratase in catechol pathway
MDFLLHAIKLASLLTGAIALGALATARAGEVYCRVAGTQGAAYGRVAGDVIRLLDAAPWNGGRETSVTTPLAGAKLLPPSEPRNILCLANSYVGKEKTPPKYIRWFAKSAGSVATDGDAVEIPPVVDQLKGEVEVVIVVGRRLKHASEADARDAIFGYAPGNEIFGFPETFQKVNGEDPARAEVMLAAGLKLGDKFSPFGPFIHRGAAWSNRMRTLTVTNSTTGKSQTYRGDCSGFLYTPERVLSELSKVLTLEPGDIVFTGTERALVLDAGDEVVAEIEGLGRLTNHVVRSESNR